MTDASPPSATAPQRPHLGYLDGWRGLAILCVVCGHFFLDRLIPALSVTGVQFFFVLSGYLIGDILLVRSMDYRTFAARRVSRIFPALLIYIAITFVAFRHPDYKFSLTGAALAVTMTLNYAMAFTHRVTLLEHLWSLCVEEHSYVVLALIAFACSRNAARAALVAIVIALACMANAIRLSHWGALPLGDMGWRTDIAAAPLLLSAGVGVLATLKDWRFPAWVSPVALAAGLWMSLTGGELVSHVAGTALLVLAMAALPSAAAWFRHAFSWRVLRWAGLMSFSLYLWQQPFYRLHLQDGVPLWIVVPGTLAAASASFFLVETPARRAINRWADDRFGAGRRSRRIAVDAAGG